MRTTVPAPGDGIPYGVRMVLLAVLALSGVIVLVNQDPPHRDAEELIADLRAGRVTKVVYDRDWPAYGDLIWSGGPFSWSQARFDEPGDVWDHRTAELVPAALERRQGAFLARVRAVAAPSVEIVLSEGSGGSGPGGLVGSPAYARWWEPFAPVAMAAEVLAWLLMLTRREHRYAGRWAWFWMFLAGGSPVYVLLEPRPLWRGPYGMQAARARLDGTRGFVLAVTVMFGTAMLKTLL